MTKVLGLVIFERRLGNSELMVKEIMVNVPEPRALEIIRLTELNISACKGCYRCLQADLECRLNDDFNFVIKK